MLQAVIFDMDGVLIDSEPFWQQAEIEVFSTVKLFLTHKMCEQTMGLRVNEAVDYWFEKQPWSHKTREQVGVEIKEKAKLLIEENANPLPGVISLVHSLHEAKIPIAVCSSSAEYIIKSVLNKFKIAEFFSVVVSGEEACFGKPHPEGYLLTAERLQVNPKQCVVIEDSLNGMISGKAARMKVIAVPDAKYFERTIYDFCDLKLASLADLNMKLLKSLFN